MPNILIALCHALGGEVADERPADDARHRAGAAYRRSGGLRGPPSRAVGRRLPGAGEGVPGRLESVIIPVFSDIL